MEPGRPVSPPRAGRAWLVAGLSLVIAAGLLVWACSDPAPAGPDPDRLLGTWKPDLARHAQLPAALRFPERRLHGLRLVVATDHLELAMDGTVRRGKARITSLPPVFYRIDWTPAPDDQTLILACDLTDRGIDLRWDGTVIPLRAGPE